MTANGQDAAGLDKVQQNIPTLRRVEENFFVRLGQLGLGLMLFRQLLLPHFRYLSNFQAGIGQLWRRVHARLHGFRLLALTAHFRNFFFIA